MVFNYFLFIEVSSCFICPEISLSTNNLVKCKVFHCLLYKLFHWTLLLAAVFPSSVVFLTLAGVLGVRLFGCLLLK